MSHPRFWNILAAACLSITLLASPSFGHGKPRHHRHHHHHRHYAPAYYAGYPYFCDVCSTGFHRERLFHQHLHHHHHVAYRAIPHVVVRHGNTFFFSFGW